MSVELLTYLEHSDRTIDESVIASLSEESYETFFSKKRGDDLPCYSLRKTSAEGYHLQTGYFIGLDWIEKDKSALYVAPKLNSDKNEIDYISMLFSSLNHLEVSSHIEELMEVKWDEPVIEIDQKQDLLTPFLVVEFLSLLKKIVRKGLKKSYYKIEENLHSRVKGKVLIGKTIKQNLLQHKKLSTYCSCDEFGLNNSENRLLKKALEFTKNYLPNYSQLTNHVELKNTFNYINPAFTSVSSDIDLSEVKQVKTNSFYKEYIHAIRLAKLILKRFGYNISNTVKQRVTSPPFWIDMSKLFEVYVLGMLKDQFHGDVRYQYQPDGSNELDFILKSDQYKMVIDAKYKLRYLSGKHEEDIRQVSGYARLNKVYDYLDISREKLIDCLIIHPDQEKGLEVLHDVELDTKDKRIIEYNRVFKLGVKLPVLK